MEVWLSPMMGFDLTAGTARILGSGDARTNWVAVPDVAAVAVAALTEDRGRNTVVELAVEHVPLEALEQQLAAADDPVARTFAALALATARGDAEDRTAELRRWVERPIGLGDFLAATAA